jgi:hypothetical protein
MRNPVLCSFHSTPLLIRSRLKQPDEYDSYCSEKHCNLKKIHLSIPEMVMEQIHDCDECKHRHGYHFDLSFHLEHFQSSASTSSGILIRTAKQPSLTLSPDHFYIILTKIKNRYENQASWKYHQQVF